MNATKRPDIETDEWRRRLALFAKVGVTLDPDSPDDVCLGTCGYCRFGANGDVRLCGDHGCDDKAREYRRKVREIWMNRQMNPRPGEPKPTR